MSRMIGMGWEEFKNVKGKVNGMKELGFDKENLIDPIDTLIEENEAKLQEYLSELYAFEQLNHPLSKPEKDMVKDAKKYLFEACHEENAVSPIVTLMYLFRNWKGEKK